MPNVCQLVLRFYEHGERTYQIGFLTMNKEICDRSEAKSFKHADGNEALFSLQAMSDFNKSERKASSTNDANIFHLDCGDMKSLYGDSAHSPVTKTADIQTEVTKAIQNVRSSIESAFAPGPAAHHVEAPKPEAKAAAPEAAKPAESKPDIYEKWGEELAKEGEKMPVKPAEYWLKRIKEHPDDFFYYPIHKKPAAAAVHADKNGVIDL
jgi:hypothetical protein